MNLANLLLVLLVVLLTSCAANTPNATSASDAPGSGVDWPDALHPVLRVGGDRSAQTRAERGTKAGEELTIYRFERCAVDTPLPVDYPPPTAPGAIELKHYPLVRRAEMNGVRSPTLAFYPLLAHIQSRQIAMTSPVEMDLETQVGAEPSRETMSFLYRRPEQGPLGPTESAVVVRDRPAGCVLALGVRGPLGSREIESALATLRALVAARAEWVEAGAPRTLEYNSPFVPLADRWAEVQIPLARR